MEEITHALVAVEKKFKKCCQDQFEERMAALNVLAKKSAPTSNELNQLVDLFNAGRHVELESQAQALIQLYPDSGFVWKVLGASLRVQGKEALTALHNATKFLPEDAESHNNLGNALRDIGKLEDAVACYRQALKIKPDYSYAYNNLGNALRDIGKLKGAAACYRRALRLKPDFAEAHFNLGNAMRDLGKLEDAVACYRQTLRFKPDLADAHSNLGRTLIELGNMVEAEGFLSKAIELSPDKAMPLASALLYIPYKQDDPRFNQLEAIYAQRGSLSLKERISLNFAMGKAMENIGQYDRSFSAYEEGNQLHYQGYPFNEAEHERFLENSCSIFTADLFNKLAAIAETLPTIQEKRVPIFIVGMPRSGTTLIEQILASHPAVYGAGELNILGDIVKKIKHLTNGEDVLLSLRKLGQEYLDRAWKLAPGARYITDKLPSNYYHLGLIHLMLPNAKIIHSLRDPMDTCFSCYAQLFTFGHDYSYDLGALGRQYMRYTKLMQHWHNVLPPMRTLDVRYEDNVADPEREAKRMLDYLGLSWDTACLKFYETERTVRTASVAQVRKPIYTSSLARWKHFEKNLGPLLELIHPAKLPDIASTIEPGGTP